MMCLFQEPDLWLTRHETIKIYLSTLLMLNRFSIQNLYVKIQLLLGSDFWLVEIPNLCCLSLSKFDLWKKTNFCPTDILGFSWYFLDNIWFLLSRYSQSLGVKFNFFWGRIWVLFCLCWLCLSTMFSYSNNILFYTVKLLCIFLIWNCCLKFQPSSTNMTSIHYYTSHCTFDTLTFISFFSLCIWDHCNLSSLWLLFKIVFLTKQFNFEYFFTVFFK